jgi:plastocyanin
MRNSVIIIAALATLAVSALAQAEDHIVIQQNKTFSTAALKAKLGDTLTFKNMDSVAHNIFSLSDAQSFDLGTFSKGETRQIKLDKPGIVEIECAVHPDMKLKVEVSK